MPTSLTTRFYHGCSMANLFCPGDRLWVDPIPTEMVRRGDVLVFLLEGVEVVHRAVQKEPQGWVTRGDCNACTDPVLVTDQVLIGRVVAFERAGITRKVWGGWRGLFWARCNPHIRFWKWQIIRGVRRLYRLVQASRLVPRLWKPVIRQITITNGSETVVKYVHRGKTVARWWPQQHVFTCRKPYDLVIPIPDGTVRRP